jgi:hypothetical protein
VAYIDLRNRAPEVQRLPDERLRVTRIYDVLNFVPKSPTQLLAEVWEPWGTQDEQFSNCRLIKQDIDGQPVEFPAPSDLPPHLIRVYEELPATAEQQVGNPGVAVNQYGYKEVTIDYLQFSAGTATYQVPGTTPAPSPFSNCILREQAFTDDGTLRKIRRIYVEGGLLSDTEELRFGGNLVVRTRRSLLTPPSIPAGYVQVTESVDFINGLPVYAIGMVNAGGGGVGGGGSGAEIGRSIEYNISPDQGTTGVTVTRIEFITPLSVTSNPITGPVGSELIAIKFDDDSGYRRWTGVYASGQGTITSDVDTKDGGKLKVYSITAINAIPATPAATIGGTVTLISARTRNGTDAAAGTVVYDYVWAEGLGEVSRDFTNSQGGPVDFDPADPTASAGAVTCTIRYLSALATAVDPTSAPAVGFTRVKVDRNDQDGYRVWTVVYGFGNGLVLDERDIKNYGTLIIYHRVAFGSAPSEPAPTIGGTLELTHWTVRNADGYDIYDYSWYEGDGRSRLSVDARPDGSLVYDLTQFTAGSAAYSLPAYPGSGTAYLVSTDEDLTDGFVIMKARYIKPPPDFSFFDTVKWTVPGLALAANPPTFDPPITRTLRATVSVAFSTTSNTATAYTVNRWAQYSEAYTRSDTGATVSLIRALDGYVGDSSVVVTGGTFRGIPVTTAIAQVYGSDPDTQPSGSTILQAEAEKYLTAIDGTTVWKNTTVTFTF